jgi:hypothetical protein
MAADRKSVVQVKFRLRKDILKQVEKAAKAADRSVNEEIERRVEQSFDERRLTSAFVGGDVNEMILRIINWAMLSETHQRGKSWEKDEAGAETIRAVADYVIATAAGLHAPAPEKFENVPSGSWPSAQEEGRHRGPWLAKAFMQVAGLVAAGKKEGKS